MHYETTLQTTHEDERLVSKLTRAAAQINMSRVEGLFKGIDRGNKTVTKVDFAIDIKESPFHRFGVTSPRDLPKIPLSNKEPDAKYMAQDSQEKTNSSTQNNNSSEIPVLTPIDKRNKSKKAASKRVTDPSKPFRTFPRGALRKGLTSKFSRDYELYIAAGSMSYDPGIYCNEEDLIIALDSKIGNSNLKNCDIDNNTACRNETNYTCGDDDNDEVFKDNSLFSSKSTPVLALSKVASGKILFKRS